LHEHLVLSHDLVERGDEALDPVVAHEGQLAIRERPLPVERMRSMRRRADLERVVRPRQFAKTGTRGLVGLPREAREPCSVSGTTDPFGTSPNAAAIFPTRSASSAMIPIRIALRAPSSPRVKVPMSVPPTNTSRSSSRWTTHPVDENQRSLGETANSAIMGSAIDVAHVVIERLDDASSAKIRKDRMQVDDLGNLLFSDPAAHIKSQRHER
jgi:hypothetical protein